MSTSSHLFINYVHLQKITFNYRLRKLLFTELGPTYKEMIQILSSILLFSRQPFSSECKKRFFSVASFRSKEMKYDIVLPCKTSERRIVGNGIIKPSYWKTGIPEMAPLEIEIKNETQIQAMKMSCSLASRILKSLEKFVKAGVTTDDIDEYVHKLCLENGAYPSPLNYHNYPKSVCTSVNNVACHGIPDSRPLKIGDIVNVDVTVFRNNMHGDCSAMFCVGDVDESGLDLCEAAKEALQAGISVCKPGRPFSAIGKIIQEVAENKNFTVVPAFLGHGIGSYFHGLPDIFHFDTTNTKYDTGQKMEAGMTFTIEPVLSEGGEEIAVLEDGWTAVTTDSSRTAQWEHTVLITDNGAVVLTV